jgi:lysophospholipase L1-like esterase
VFALVVGTVLMVSCSDDPTPIAPAPSPDPLKIVCPASVSAQSPTGQPIAIQYSAVTATSGAPPITISCVPPTGSAFPVGSTMVTCAATDLIRRTDACTFGVTVTSPPRISLTSFVAFGDSITAGEIITEGDRFGLRAFLVDLFRSYPKDLLDDLIAYYMAQSQSIRVDNQGRSAETTAGGLQRLPGVLAAVPYQTLLLMEGANDLPNIDGALINIRAMVHAAKSSGLRVFLASIPPENPNADGSCVPGAIDRGRNAPFVVPYNTGLQGVATTENATFVDVYQAFGPNPSGDLLDCDGLHPTAKGYQLIADTFFTSIKWNLSVQATSSPLRMMPVVPPRPK